MKRLIVLIMLLVATQLYAQDAKVTSYTVEETPASADIMWLIKNPGGPGTNRQMTVGNLTKGLSLTNFPATTDVKTMLGSANNAAILSNIGAQAALTYPITGVAAPTAGYLMKWGASGNTAVDGLKMGSMQDAKYCTYTTADGLTCTSLGGEGIMEYPSVAGIVVSTGTAWGTSIAATIDGSDVTFPGAVSTTATDGYKRLTMYANTVLTNLPTSAAYELYVKTTSWRVNQAGTEYFLPLAETAQPIFTGLTASRLITLPDAAVTLAPTASPTFTGTVTLPASTIGAAESKTVMKTEGATIIVGSGAAVIANGVHRYTAFRVPFKCTLTTVIVTVDDTSTGTLTVDVWKGQLGENTGLYNLSASNSIFTSNPKPAITDGDKNVSVTTFDTGEAAVAAGDWFILSISNAVSHTIAAVAFEFTRAD